MNLLCDTRSSSRLLQLEDGQGASGMCRDEHELVIGETAVLPDLREITSARYLQCRHAERVLRQERETRGVWRWERTSPTLPLCCHRRRSGIALWILINMLSHIFCIEVPQNKLKSKEKIKQATNRTTAVYHRHSSARP